MPAAGAPPAVDADGTGPARPGDAATNRAVMDRIGVAFDETRRDAWAPVLTFLEHLPQGARILDLAGGNGRHARAAQGAGFDVVLVDVSRVLTRIAREKATGDGAPFAVVEGDAGALPFADEVFDGALFVAGLHCIRGRAGRLRALEELRRVLVPGGRALVTVWSSEQDRFRSVVAGQRRAEAVDALTADAEVGDVLVPWSRGLDAPVARFFHVYSEGELRRELEDAGFHVEDIRGITITSGSTADNWFAAVRAP